MASATGPKGKVEGEEDTRHPSISTCQTLENPHTSSVSPPCRGYNKITISDFNFKTSAETKHFSHRKRKRPSLTSPKRFLFCFFLCIASRAQWNSTNVLVLLSFYQVDKLEKHQKTMEIPERLRN